MRILKAGLLFLLLLILFGAALFYIAGLLPEHFYAGIIIPLLTALALLIAAFYLGYTDKGILLLQLPLLLLCLAPILLLLLIFMSEYISLRSCLLYCLYLLLPLFFSGYSARLIYLQKSRKNEE